MVQSTRYKILSRSDLNLVYEKLFKHTFPHVHDHKLITRYCCKFKYNNCPYTKTRKAVGNAPSTAAVFKLFLH